MIRSWLRDPVFWFGVLACAFGWAFVIAHAVAPSLPGGQFPLGPGIAAALVAVATGRRGLRRWLGALATLRAAPRWYLFALLAPLVILATAVAVNRLLGTSLPTGAELAGWRTLAPTFLGILVAIGIGEEAGWSGFAAPTLLERHGFVRAWLVLAAIRTIWHLPLMLSGDLSLTLGIGGNFAFQFLVLWLVARTRVWFLAALWHAVLNTFGGSFVFQFYEGADRDRLGLLMVAGYVALAIAVGFLDRRRLGVIPGPGDPQPAAT